MGSFELEAASGMFSQQPACVFALAGSAGSQPQVAAVRCLLLGPVLVRIRYLFFISIRIFK
jgi:hypothetical protein